MKRRAKRMQDSINYPNLQRWFQRYFECETQSNKTGLMVSLTNQKKSMRINPCHYGTQIFLTLNKTYFYIETARKKNNDLYDFILTICQKDKEPKKKPRKLRRYRLMAENKKAKQVPKK